MHTITYSTQPAGAKTRILATQDGSTRTVTSLPADLAPGALTALAVLTARRLAILIDWVRAHPGQVCPLRRDLMRAVTTGVTGGVPPVASAVADLAALAAQATEAERRALTDEVGRLLEDTEDVLVPAELTGEYGHTLFWELANDWLATQASAEDLLAIADPDDPDSTALYEGLLAFLRGQDEDIDAACEQRWVDVYLDRPALRAWLRRNRPALADQLEPEDELD